ncbi:Inner membrane protein YecN [Methylomonas albis]|uniref:MAPEG family protein n=1 Tax=Methylomonas albis TaxID=1854563 RepID=A0ABR9D712_9GAMM|nr:MAPEG family protein [Methylomonas albis]MBD9358888.1 MAPEG family protein [Methylomonas albis]CAD6882361.1 Inner membrane protein YecN [Methylomonas albis]
MISAVYAALAALLIAWLSLRVIKLRRAKKVIFGDGGETDLQIAIRAQGNATEYIPILLILLLVLELSGGHVALLHTGGLAIILGRVVHARGLLHANLDQRVLGMQMTIFTLIGLAIANFGYAAHAAFG